MPRHVGVVDPPPGVIADFDYSNPWLYKVNMTLIGVGLVLSFLLLVLRIYTKTKILRKFGWEDAFIVLAWRFSSDGYLYSGVGVHMWNVTEEMFATYQKVILAAAVVYVPALAFAKMSLIFLYRRIMEKQEAYNWALNIISAIVCGYSLALVFALIFACNPIAMSWDLSITEGTCISRQGLYIATAVTNIVTDLALILLPIPLVVGLQMPGIQKCYLIVVFGVGCATVVTSILRLATLVPFLTASDVTYELAWPQLWINVEANLIIICPCLPSLRQFLRHHAPGWLGEAGSNARRYFTHSGSASRNRFKSSGSRQPDEIALTENGGSLDSRSRIVKEVAWNVTEERLDEDSDGHVKGKPANSFGYQS
ncbi:hypothetical protein N7517_010993 [Penicillium concentricum]|uniref:Rhodopsin domain-containing protein n=1 Tax=Penicillium concentricum TaxID=293559 RepID=A0A9W9RBR3_9EURO|nr:uncharacterized protein N7517_010993 [Penicillium concentricum]KAJ5356384.1 hypothetical protein N7517_010993 [Penicillium concentricum]